MEQNNKRLQELKGSDYKIVDEQPDIKGWPLYNSEHQKLGKVEDLLFDPQMKKVRYIIADLDGSSLDFDDKEVLIPIGIAELHEKDDEVIIPGITASQLKALPEYNDDLDVTDSDEQTIMSVFSGGATTGALAGANSDRYSHAHFDDQNLYRHRNKQSTTEISDNETIPVIKEELNIGKKEVETGRVRLRSRVVEEPVQEEVNLKRETADIERKAVDRPASADAFKEENIEMRLNEEVPVVNKETRVVEEVRLSKEQTEEDATIRETLR